MGIWYLGHIYIYMYILLLLLLYSNNINNNKNDNNLIIIVIIVIVVIVIIVLITVINNDMMIWDNDIGDNQSDMIFWVCLKIYPQVVAILRSYLEHDV